jgi:three-Cys-motif partner protein
MISVLDDLPIRPVGEWAYEKIYRLVQYFGIFAGGMKKRWPSLNYVEIGCGPGRCVLRENCLEIDGTALAIIRNPNFFSLQKAIFIDASPRVAEILNARIGALGAASIASAVVGDYSNAADLCGILKGLPDGFLNFIFIDPTECDVPFETIEQIVRQLKNADLLVNVALGTDANRNLVSAIRLPSHVKVREKYEAFLGKLGFCAQSEVIELAKLADHIALRRKFAEAYKERLAHIGFVYTDIQPVRHYYYLLFASRSEKGLEFWRKSCRIAPDNQRQLFS